MIHNFEELDDNCDSDLAEIDSELQQKKNTKIISVYRGGYRSPGRGGGA